MDPNDLGIEQITDEDRAYRGSRFAEVHAALFANPALLLILSVYLLVPLTYSTLIGLLSGAIVRYLPPATHHSVALPPS